MDKERDYVNLNFSYDDRFGNNITLNKTLGVENIDLNVNGEIGFIIDQFKIFLRSCEFNDDTINKLSID